MEKSGAAIVDFSFPIVVSLFSLVMLCCQEMLCCFFSFLRRSNILSIGEATMEQQLAY